MIRRRLSQWIKSFFAWHTVRCNGGPWVYCENSITGQRKAVWRGGCFSPLDHDWLRKGDIVVGPRGTYVIGSEQECWLA